MTAEHGDAIVKALSGIQMFLLVLVVLSTLNLLFKR